MTQNEKLEILADIFEEDIENLTAETVLNDLDNWDSVAALSIMSMLDESFGKEIKALEIRKLTTISELLELMQ